MRIRDGSVWSAAALAAWLGLGTGGCGEPIEEAADEVAEEVDRGFDAMREENQRRIRQIAESSHEMEEERRRVLEQARERAEE